MMGNDNLGMQDRLLASNIAKNDVIIYGELLQEEGYSSDSLWEMLTQRYKL